MTERQFADNFLVYFFDGVDPFPWRRWSKPANVEALIEIIRPYIFNSSFDSKCSVRVVDKIFRLSADERRRYSRFKDAFLRGKLYVCFFTVAQKFQMAYTTTCAEKYRAVVKIVEEILSKGEKVVIFVKYVSEALLLRAAFGGLLYTGKCKDDLSRFEKDENVLICTYGVGSVGLNLQCAIISFIILRHLILKKRNRQNIAYTEPDKQDVLIFIIYGLIRGLKTL